MNRLTEQGFDFSTNKALYWIANDYQAPPKECPAMVRVEGGIPYCADKQTACDGCHSTQPDTDVETVDPARCKDHPYAHNAMDKETKTALIFAATVIMQEVCGNMTLSAADRDKLRRYAKALKNLADKEAQNEQTPDHKG